MMRRRIILVLAVVLLTFGLWWLLRVPQPEPVAQVVAELGVPTKPSIAATPTDSPPKPEAELRQKAVAMVGKIFGAPIAFYGRVVDQNGDPVPDAEVGYKAADKFNAPGTLYTGKSDAAGYFQITGINGGGLLVGVGKEGYYPVEGKSSANFGYGMGTDSTRRSPPTKDNPAIFLLHKMGETEPLIARDDHTRIPRDGTPVEINLANGRIVPAGQGDLRVEAWTDDQNLNEKRRYNWRCRITVPGGGLVERKEQFDFEAPEDGYEESAELEMLGDAEQWSPQQKRDYFAKLSDGRYARFKFTMFAGGDHFFRLESFLNPTPGSRNLEYAPKQTAIAP